MKTFGICQQGNERSFERWLVAVCIRFAFVQYVEIGVNEGGTLISVCEILSERKGDEYSVLGIEPDKEFWIRSNKRILDFNGSVSNKLSKDYDESDPKEVHFTLIDGCHGKPCVMADFELMAPKTPTGGIIAFHDVCESCQHGSLQPHCGTGIEVRAALEELGLLEGKRHGWMIVEETGAQWSMAFFEKT